MKTDWGFLVGVSTGMTAAWLTAAAIWPNLPSLSLMIDNEKLTGISMFGAQVMFFCAMVAPYFAGILVVFAVIFIFEASGWDSD